MSRHICEHCFQEHTPCCPECPCRQPSSALPDSETPTTPRCICDEGFGLNLSCPLHKPFGREASGSGAASDDAELPVPPWAWELYAMVMGWRNEWREIPDGGDAGVHAIETLSRMWLRMQCADAPDDPRASSRHTPAVPRVAPPDQADYVDLEQARARLSKDPGFLASLSAEGRAALTNIPETESIGDALARSEQPRVAPPDQAGRRDVTELEGEMAKQASLGHKMFCVGIHVHEGGEQEAEWIEWPEAFAMLRRASSVVETAGARPYTPEELDERFAIRRVAELCQPLSIYPEEVERMIATARAAVQQEGATDALREIEDEVQRIRGALWDGVSYVPIESEAADALANTARRAMEHLDALYERIVALRTPPAGRASGASE